MEAVVILWVKVLSGPLEGTATGLVYTSLPACEAAVAPVTATLDGQYDYAVRCEDLSPPDAGVRPKRNPLYEEN